MGDVVNIVKEPGWRVLGELIKSLDQDSNLSDLSMKASNMIMDFGVKDAALILEGADRLVFAAHDILTKGEKESVPSTLKWLTFYDAIILPILKAQARESFYTSE